MLDFHKNLRYLGNKILKMLCEFLKCNYLKNNGFWVSVTLFSSVCIINDNIENIVWKNVFNLCTNYNLINYKCR